MDAHRHERPSADGPLAIEFFIRQETGHNLAIGILRADEELGGPGDRQEPPHAEASLAHAIRSEQPRVDDWLILPVPGMGMVRIDQSKLGEEKPGLHLQPKRQPCGGQEGFFQLDCGVTGGRIHKKDEVRFAGKVWIDRPSEGELHVL